MNARRFSLTFSVALCGAGVFLLGLVLATCPPPVNAADINRYGTAEYWEWYNSTRRQIRLIPWYTKYDSVLFFDHFYANGALHGRTPDASYYGGTWADAADRWEVKTAGLGHGILEGSCPLYTGGYFDLGTVNYPVFYNLAYRALELFESGVIERGWTIRQGAAGALNIISNCASEDETIITVRSWDAAGNTTNIATGHTTGITGRPIYKVASLVIEDTGSTLTVYWDFLTGTSGSAVGLTATTHVLTTWTENWQAHTAFGPFSGAGFTFTSDWALVKQIEP